jgi:hypothetical protein
VTGHVPLNKSIASFRLQEAPKINALEILWLEVASRLKQTVPIVTRLRNPRYVLSSKWDAEVAGGIRFLPRAIDYRPEGVNTPGMMDEP